MRTLRILCAVVWLSASGAVGLKLFHWVTIPKFWTVLIVTVGVAAGFVTVRFEKKKAEQKLGNPFEEALGHSQRTRDDGPGTIVKNLHP